MKYGWHLENSFIDLPNTFFTHQAPDSVDHPKLVIFNATLADQLGLDAEALEKNGELFFSGNELPAHSKPIAQAYAGHQFGHFTMLGDGRAILLGEQINPEGTRYDIQLKGAGRTPYSRGGDGRAALGPMLREYLISEAMYSLGIPTTRSLAVVTTGEHIMRETMLPGAILTRVASSHIRIGTFQYAAAKGNTENLRLLALYTLQRHDPSIDINAQDAFERLLTNVMKRQAQLVAKWQLVGFIHGVMNTDNITMSGETIDYGPCAFMDVYDPKTVFSSIDRQGRYAYGNQPHIMGWNIARFAEALVPLLHQDIEQAVEVAQHIVNDFPQLYEQYWLNGMREKLGLFNNEPDDVRLIQDLFQLMYDTQADYTNTFRNLTLRTLERSLEDEPEETKSPHWQKWLERWRKRQARQELSREALGQNMQRVNPSIIPRNQYVEQVLHAAVEQQDIAPFQRFLKELRNPFAYDGQRQYVQAIPPKQPYQTFCGT